MKYILIFLFAVFNTLLCTLRYILYFVITFVWKFKLLKYSDVITNHGGYYIQCESTVEYKPISLKYDNNPLDTFKRSLKFESVIIE